MCIFYKCSDKILPVAEFPCGQMPAHGPQSSSEFLISTGFSKSDNLNVERGYEHKYLFHYGVR